ncbi:TonB-dependent receptor plug domain-containing protein [Endozoicomonas arenosclerae]|uniref:TonB-dependent receptor plug domain-containing protein n=1 Tax=Endozoicomonas arenosclerae TaxID=1633495 RepID=UPI000781A85B|nr:TonB-dependent receptor [Endozoicomonas arenosclerae]
METPRKTLLATAITAVMAGYSFPALAADTNDSSQEVEKIEKVTVTGSRIARIDVEGATPLTVIDREYIEDSGFMTVADVLQGTPYNTAGSYSAQGNNSWGSQATINLRGLGSQNTLVLIDGRRVPWSGVMYGGSVDVNSIPAAAVERIEIMPDGASAIYGSDAVAGVVNIIMRKDYDGAQISVRGSRPDDEGADENGLSLLWGTSFDQGNVLVSLEHDRTENIIMKDREYAKADKLNSKYIQDVENVSQTARTTYQHGDWTYKPIAGSCNKANFYGPYDDSAYPGDKVCAYDYTAEADLTPEINRSILNIMGNYDLDNGIQVTGGITLSHRDVANTAAPVPAWFNVDGTTVGGAQFFADNGMDPNTNSTATVGYRFDVLGNRVYEIDGLDISGHIGLSGDMELNFVDDFQWNVTYMESKSDYTSDGTNMLLKDKVEELVNANADFFLENGDINSKYHSQISHTWEDQVDVTSRDVNGGFGFSLGELAGGPIGFYFGGQYMYYDMERKFDPLSTSGAVTGVFGGTYGGERTVKAVYGETLLPITDKFEVSMALRHDKYDDFGDTTNPKVSFRYQPMDELLIRGSWGTSFKAPNFQQLYTPANTGYYTVTDYKTCADQGISVGNCNIEASSVAVTNQGNKDLGPEESQMATLGVVIQPNDALTIRGDLYQIKTEDLITQISSDYILQAEAQAGSSAAVRRDGQGRIQEIFTSNVNIAEQEQSGIDLSLTYDHELGSAGTMDFSVAGTYIFKYEYADEPGLEAYDHIGNDGLPRYRVNSTIGYNTPDDMHRIALTAYHIASQYDYFRAIASI